MNHAYTVEQIRDRVWHIDESGLNAMYLVKGDKLAALIDTGTGIGDLKALAQEITGQPLVILCTHGHVDHVGGAGQFEKVYLAEADFAMAEAVTVEEREDYIRRMEEAGAVESGDVSIAQEMKNSRKPVFIPLREGDRIDLGGRTLEVYEFPGHTEGSVCFLDREERVLFSGDNMNDIELLTAKRENKKDLIREWLKAGERMMTLKNHFDLCCGGHSVFSVEKAKSVLSCGRKALDGKINCRKIKIHFFTAEFYVDEGVYLYAGDFDQLFERQPGK